MHPPRGRAERPEGGFWVRWWPAVLFLAYNAFTVALFAFGPIPYPVAQPWRLYPYLAASLVALALGYLAGPKVARRVLPSLAPRVPPVPVLIAVSSLLNILLLVPATLFMTEGSFDLIAALSDPSAAYQRSARVAAATTNPWMYAVLLVAPVLFLTAPLALFFWRRLPRVHRLLAAAAIAVTWASGVMLGRNKGFADLFLLVLVFFFVHLARRPRLDLRRWAAGAAVVLGVFLVFFVIFLTGAAGRMSYTYTKGYVRAIDGYLDYDNVFLEPFPDDLKPGVGHLYGYLTQGYYGLSMATQLDFVWTRGLGNSYFLHLFEERVLGSTYARENCYPARIETEFGYSMYTSWHSIHPWLASDLTFAGTLVFVLLVGMVLAVSWHETRVTENPLSVAMFATVCLMLFYFPANNQSLGFPVQFSSTVGVFMLWLVAGGGAGRTRRG